MVIILTIERYLYTIAVPNCTHDIGRESISKMNFLPLTPLKESEFTYSKESIGETTLQQMRKFH